MKGRLLIFFLCALFLFSCSNEYTTVGLPAHLTSSTAQTRPSAGPLKYKNVPSDGQYQFIGPPSISLEVRLIPNLGQRKKLGLTSIENIQGVTHFFLDHDLTSGFVHAYTKTMFNRLRPDDFVMHYAAFDGDPNRGTISYRKKKDLTEKDVLGKNFGFFRQWKLSEIQWRKGENGDEVYLKPCRFANFCGCPQTIDNPELPYSPEIPFWTTANETGFVPVSRLNKLGKFAGGTVAIVWEQDYNGQKIIYFRDVHASFETIWKMAKKIEHENGVDPHICISDAGPFARKVKANANNVLDCNLIDAIAPNGLQFGAGFGYVTNL